jgi:hypothetical protein
MSDKSELPFENNEIVMTATSNRTYYHKVQDHSLPISNPA